MRYMDFELEIGIGSGREYPVAVVSSPAGEARETMHFPFGELELQNCLLALENALLRSGGKRRRVLTPQQRAVRDFGQSLFDALLSGEVRSRYDVSQQEALRQNRGLRLKLRILPPELAMLPWEFLYDRREAEYVCLSRNTPVVRYLELPRPPRPLVVAPPLRVLGMVASPTDQEPLEVELEKQRVSGALQDLQAQGLVELHWLPGQTWRDLQRAMRKDAWHIFHFIGHGGFDQNRDEGFIALADESGATQRLTATQLGRLLANHRSLRLALLNSCEGARGGQSDVFSSTASILVQRGIPAVLAMQYEITDGAAIELARTLYESLADGLPVDAALVEARAAISLAVNNTVEWGTPVLFTRAPNGVLFEIEEREERGEGRPQSPERSGRGEARSEERPVPPIPIQVSDTAPAPRERLIELYQILSARFVEDELRTLCFHLGVEYDDLGGEGRAGHARELLKYFDNRGQISTLIKSGQQLRPDISWPPVAEPTIADQATPPPARRETRPRQERKTLFANRQPFEPEMILIPAGEFLMGSDPKKDENAYGDEQPQHTLYLPDYYLAKTPVTNAQYAAFVRTTGHNQPEHWKDGRPPGDKEDHPVVYVSWHDAIAYCRWLAEVTGRPYSLPSEAQWEKGARGSDGRIYPWGDQWDAKLCNSRECISENNTTPVGAYPGGASPYGLLDMAGNVWEWTSSRKKGYPYQADDGRENTSDTGNRVLRGGAWNLPTVNARSAIRSVIIPGYQGNYIGFRCVVAPSSSL